MLSRRVRHPLTTTLIVVLSWREQTDMGQICAALSLMFLHNIGISIVCKVGCRLFSSLKQQNAKPKSAGVVMFTLPQCYCRHAPCWSILTNMLLVNIGLWFSQLAPARDNSDSQTRTIKQN